MKPYTNHLLFFFAAFLAFVIGATLPSCSSVDCKDPKNGSNAKCVVKQAVIDCTVPNAQKFVTDHEAEVAKFFTGGGIDWTAAEDALKHLGVDEAGCVLGAVVDHYLAKAPEAGTGSGAAGSDGGPGSAVKATAPLDASAIKSHSSEIAGRLWPGKTFKATP